MYVSDDVLNFVLIMIAAAGALYGFAAMRSSESATVENSSRVSKVPTKLAPAAAFKVIVGTAPSSGYRVASIDEGTLRLCLEEGASMSSFGFFMPIRVVAAEEGAVIEVGTKSKIFQMGPIVTRAHERCASSIRASLFAATQA